MITIKLKHVLIVALLALTSGPAASAENIPLTDPSLESAFGGTNGVVASGWWTFGSAMGGINVSGGFWGNMSNREGPNAAFAVQTGENEGGSIYQTVSLNAGVTYSLSVAIGTSASVDKSTGKYALVFSSADLGTLHAEKTGTIAHRLGGFFDDTVTFTPTVSGTYQFGLRNRGYVPGTGANNNQSTIFFDNVRLFAQVLPPASFTRTISTATQSVTIDFQQYSVRNANFEVLVQQADGSYLSHTPEPSRTYLGTVRGHPGAIACGLLRADNTLWARVSFEDGSTWASTGGTASGNWASTNGIPNAGSMPFIPQWPTTLMGSGGAGSNVFAAELGLDLTHNHYNACGGTPDLAVAKSEFSVISSNMLFLRDAAITHLIGKIVIRADATQDPYAPDGGDTGALLTRVKDLWNAGNPMGASHQIAAVIHSQANGGLAWVGSIGTSNRYSSNDSDAWGDFSLVWRHEAGHNWGSNHYDGGGNPEGSTIMSNNGLSRFSSSELERIIRHRNTRTILTNLGPLPLPIPPRANMDRVAVNRNTTITIDVLDNDSDSNGDAISLLSFDATSNRGGSLARSSGTGPGGRDEIIYTASPDYQNGTDFFTYRIADAAGNTATGFVAVQPIGPVFTPLDRWTLDEITGSQALNLARNLHGNHQNGVLVGQAAATPVTGRSAGYDGTNDHTVIPPLGLSGTSVSFTAWVRRDGNQASNAAVFFTRNGSGPETGLVFSNSSRIRYRWNGGGSTFDPGSNFNLPDGQWCLVSMVAEPGGVTLHLHTATGLVSTRHSTMLTPADFGGNFLLGRNQPDSGSPVHFRGSLDDVRVYLGSLNADQVRAIYSEAIAPPDVAMSAPHPNALVNPQGTVFRVSSTTVPPLRVLELRDALSGMLYGMADNSPLELAVDFASPGPKSVNAVVSYGNWGYHVPLGPVGFTVLEEPRPVVSLMADGLPRRDGSVVTADYVFRRSSGLGSLTVPFAMSGSAVAGIDYTALPASVTFTPGQTELRLTLTPLPRPDETETRIATLTLTQTSDFVIDGPPAASLEINSSVRSIVTGGWQLATTWSNDAPAPATGTQNQGIDYRIRSGHTVTSSDINLPNQTMVARAIQIESNGVLSLTHHQGGGLVTAVYDLPRLRAENGSTIRLRATWGSVRHLLSNDFHAAGNTTVQFDSGWFDNRSEWSGRISGTGTITLLAESPSSGTPFHYLQVNSEQNPYQGNWIVSSNPANRENSTGLIAGAPKALGTGTVTLGRRARLVNGHHQGLDSLSGITLNGNQARLELDHPVQGPHIPLALSGGSPVAPVVRLGLGNSTLGSLSGTTGTIAGIGTALGFGPPSQLTIHQQTDATFSGAVGTNLRFVKAGPALLTLSGDLSASLPLSIQAGTLDLGTGDRTIGSLEHDGGMLRAHGGSTTIPPITVTGQASFGDAMIHMEFVTEPTLGVPYPVLAYGSLAGTPTLSVSKPGNQTWIITPDYGTGTHSLITATFTEPIIPSYATWAATHAGGQSAGLDFDGDGIPNGVEYFMGVTTPGFTANPPIIGGMVVWPMNPDFVGTYGVQTSDDLVTWTPATTGVVETPGVSVEYTLPTGDTKRFIRIEVIIP